MNASTPAKRSRQVSTPGTRYDVSSAASRKKLTPQPSISSAEAVKTAEVAVAPGIPASVMLELPPSLCVCVPLSVLGTRASQAAARDFRHTLAMRQSVDITFYHPGWARCWARIIAARSPLRMENLHGRTFVAATPVADADLRAMIDMFRLSHPCKVTLGLYPD